MRLPFVSRRQHDAEIAALKHRVLATEDRHDQVEDERRRLAGQYAVLEERYTDTAIVNECLTEDLAKAREELAEVKAQASDSAAERWRAEAKREKKRADRLQRQYDDAVGMNTARGDRGLYDSEHWKPPVSLDAKGAAS